MKKLIALLSIFVLSFSLIVLVQKAYALDYYIQPDFPDGTSIPVNVESTLTATLKRYDGTTITQSITVYVQFQWESRPTPYSSEVNTGKVYIKVTPPTTGSKSVTFSSDSGLFATVTSTVNCVPGITVEFEGTKAQFIDPISHKDILLKIRAKETAAWSYVSVVTTKEVSNVKYPSNAPSGTTLTPTFTPDPVESGVYELSCDINNDFLGTYTLTVKVTYMDYYPIPASFTVDVKSPVVSAKYSFQTGESITITPGINSGQSIEIKPGCSYVDIEFTDARNNPLSVTPKDIEIESPSGTIFSWTSGYVSVEQLSSNKVRAYFTFVESWYVIRLSGQVIISGYASPIPLTEDTVKVATVSTGFNIWDFITNPWIMLPLGLVFLYLIIKLTGKKKEKEE